MDERARLAAEYEAIADALHEAASAIAEGRTFDLGPARARLGAVEAPIGTVRSSRSEVRDDDWDRERSWIELDARFGPEALAGLDTFSHVEVVFRFDRVDPASVETGARHPRGNADWPAVGIFAQRGKNRPNRIGTTVCRVVRVEGATVQVEGLDAVDGTPVLDLKPWVREFGPRGEVKQPAWMDALMRGYWG